MTTTIPRKILLVEDDVLIAMTTAKNIKGFGYDVVSSSSGEKAVEVATGETKIDLILMDIDLGKGLDGPGAAEKILEKKAIPVVFLTSHAEREMVEKVRGITRYGYVIKNSGDFVLRSSIEMAFELFDTHKKMQASGEKLRVHQAELQMQNEELRRMQNELETSKWRYFDLFDLAPAGYVTVNAEDRIMEANLPAAELFRTDRSVLVGRKFSSLIQSDDQDIYYLHRKLLVEDGLSKKCVLRMMREDGALFKARLQTSAVKNNGSGPIFRFFIMDED
jgi:PAS domain S-box-containing protein